MKEGAFSLSGCMEESGNICRLPTTKISTLLLSIWAASLAHHKSFCSNIEKVHNSPFQTFTGSVERKTTKMPFPLSLNGSCHPCLSKKRDPFTPGRRSQEQATSCKRGFSCLGMKGNISPLGGRHLSFCQENNCYQNRRVLISGVLSV